MHYVLHPIQGLATLLRAVSTGLPMGKILEYDEACAADTDTTYAPEDIIVNLPHVKGCGMWFDHHVTEERKLDSVFHPRTPQGEVDGHIIHVFSGVRNVSQYDVVVLNLGDRDGISIGDVLAVHGKGETVKDQVTGELVKLPDERRGVLMVFRTFEKVSYGLILRAEAPLQVMDAVKNPK